MRLHQDFAFGLITDDPLADDATTVNSSEFVALLEVSGGDTMVLVLDPLGRHGAPEIVTVTAHAGSATSVTVTRGAEGTVAREHPADTMWAQAATAQDYEAVAVEGTAILSTGEDAGKVLTADGSDGASWEALPEAVTNYKTSTQAFSTNTTFANVSGADAPAFSFDIAANEVWEVEYWIPVAFSGGGGVKFQLTGPASPSGVAIAGERGAIWQQDSTSALSFFTLPFTAVTAFSTAFANSSANSSTAGDYNASNPALVHARAIIRNGANAGTVTLQAAQHSGSGTTTLGAGCFMRAERIG